MAIVLNPSPAAPPTPPTTADALANICAQLRAIPPRLFATNTQALLAGAALVWNNKQALSDSDTPLTPQQIFTAMGTDGGDLVAMFTALATFLNTQVPGTIPATPALTVDGSGNVTVTGG